MIKGWNEIKGEGVLTIQKTYPDGTDVVITIRKQNDSFAIWSSAESRTSGPNESLDGLVTTFDEAKKILTFEAQGWDQGGSIL